MCIVIKSQLLPCFWETEYKITKNTKSSLQKAAEEHVEYFTLECGCDLTGLPYGKYNGYTKPCRSLCFAGKLWHMSDIKRHCFRWN